MLFHQTIWFFNQAGLPEVLGALLIPMGLGIALYQLNYLWIAGRELAWRAAGRPEERLGEAPTAALTIPSLLRRPDELEGICTAMQSACANGYPGTLHVVAAVDGRRAAPHLYAALERWVDEHPSPDHVRLHVTATPVRSGKAVAIDVGVRYLARTAPERPRLFFNMDADCELGPRALERLAHRLTRLCPWTREPARIVTSHVAVRPEVYWRGWRHFFSMAGQLELSVAREYLVSIGLGRHNSRLLPHTGASGALYVTWFDVLDAAPRYATYLRTLTPLHWLRWLIGHAPPSFEAMRDRLEANPCAVAGMGDDTWISWMALAGRWRSGRLEFDLPRTPAHASGRAVVSFLFRPFRYAPRAFIFTSTPTTLRSLYRQRVRWNVSRIWTTQRWYPALLFDWSLGLPVAADILITVTANLLAVLGLVLVPMTDAPTMWFPLILVVVGGFAAQRLLSTLLGLLLLEHRGRWRLLLALPQAGLYHFVVNILSTVDGFARQVLGFGMRTGFAPEETLKRGGVGRIALAFRVRRALGLMVRSVIRGDVPLGAFWLGWGETPWTRDGYDGWDGTPAPREPVEVATLSAERLSRPPVEAP
ncbi:MAG TPA: hypothetical protein RMH99_03740 [Sandaracinaceae bacterium LLY-WYZ-13_1]|nr:hypothetical protein [Sandaracinaceae bacterium LLY-WYZ-13_1]